ncbi:MAG: hypothetical protein IJ386_07320 [Clostridia bacterium]|nr:hypothetical protein [Clostridia bacterium]
MKNRIKALLCIALCAAVMMSSMASCVDRKEDDNKRPAVTGTNKETVDGEYDFVDDDFDEAEFKILHYGDSATDFHDAYIWSDGISGGVIGDAVAERNRNTEEMYNVRIAAEECGPMNEAVSRQQAGQCDFELIYEWRSRSTSAALDGMLYDFLDLENVNFDRSYWVPSAVEDLTVCNNMFIATNYISMNSLSWANMLFFNKVLMDKLNYDYPYELVYADQWLVDTYITMVTESEEDVNGDGELTAEDQFGIFGGGPDYIYNEPWYEIDGDGNYKVIGYTERLISLYNEYSTKLDNVSSVGYYDVWDDIDTSISPSKHIATRMVMFGEDHALFMPGTIDMTKELLNMKSDYGVCPNPKLESDDEWFVELDYNAPMFSMPLQLEDPEMTGMILDYLAYESEQHLLPAYYETTIKTKRMQDTRDYDMLDIVKNNITIDGLATYGGNGVPRSDMLTSGNFASVWRRHENKAQAKLDEVIAILEELDY